MQAVKSVTPIGLFIRIPMKINPKTKMTNPLKKRSDHVPFFKANTKAATLINNQVNMKG